MTSALAIEIAELMGWTKIDAATANSIGQIWARKPDGSCGVVPKYDKHAAAAFELLEYVGRLDAVGTIAHRSNSETGHSVCYVTWNAQGVMIERSADTLAQAVALACRDALRALKEATG